MDTTSSKASSGKASSGKASSDKESSDKESSDKDNEIPLLFEQDYLDKFHKKVGFPKHTRILCKSEFFKWWELKKNTTRSMRKKTLDERHRRSSTEKNIMREREFKVGQAIGTFICKTIEKDYATFTWMNVFASDEYDIAIVVDTRHDNNDKTLTMKRKKIYGFIISQYGEFTCKPNVFALNLVCANHGSIEKDFIDNPSFGRKLVALYLCCVLRLKDENINKECVLELGGGVSNVAAFLTYIRLGFRADLGMFKDKCISDIESLPMSIDLTKKDKFTSTLTRSNRPTHPSLEVAIINAATGTHLIRLENEPLNYWKNIIKMKDRDAQTEVLQEIEKEYYRQLRPLVEANPESYSSSVRKHFGLGGSSE